MSIHVALTHRTVYTYDRRVSLTPQVIRLRPAPHSRTRVLSYSLDISPKPHFINWQQDPNANWLARIVFPEKVDHFAVTVDLVADMAVYNPFDFFLEPEAELYPFAYPESLAEELAPYRRPVAAGPGLSAFLATVSREPRRCVDFLVDLNARLQREIKYLVRLEPGVQTPEETLGLGSGSCRDTAWLLVAMLRHLGFAARFVSGYLIQLTPDQKPLDGPAGPSADFTDLHAWTEVYLPGAGWVGLDPTSGLLAGEGHIPLAATPDTPSAAPVSGGVEPCETTFDFTMEVRRLHETPRVTKPYTEAQWQAILDLGHAVDRRLTDGDTRLTMGGEPTFVSIDDMDGPEWNTDAVGPTKERLATVLLHRLKDRFAPGGLMLFGQGKWYPGEPLPRWAHHLYWRTDGLPLVQDPEVLGDPAQPGAHTIDAAGAFMTALAETLAVDPAAVQPAFEDPWQMMAQESRLPINLEPGDERLKDPLARARLARALERGLATPVGYVLPVQRWNSPAHAPRWLTEIWQFRQGRCYLIPGDSVMGLRLPLESLPHLSATQYPFLFPVDPFVPRGPLPPLPAPRLQRRLPADQARAQAAKSPAEQARAEQTSLPDQEPLAAATGRGVVRTAVCGEIRQGRLHVFLPPAEALEDYIELVEAVEATARRLGVQVILEGYPPPQDPRINVLKVTPDPGVIEVNVHPAGSWDELVHITETLYDEARHVRLGTEKFMIDGRHVGTGGGNHLVVGGATPADSPFLRRPDLLGSLIRFWQGHPALSYLFSGLFIGPTSQAPRLDEARDETLYDVALALDLLPSRAQAEAGGVAPWVVDRILRDLLIDVTGNTHRTEISIDKLYSPDGPAGRLGLVEFRGFEMPPHARMSLVQQLLLRALIARFWETPFTAPLVPWGHALRDRFMLPYYVEQDLRDLLADMARAGYPFDPAWFAPHLAFRFPTYGTVHHGGVDIEVRHALEPWHVMGEDPGPGGTVRFVDSSVERLQIRTQGMVPGRHVLTCNGRRLPLTATGTPGESVAGVRYRAWLPPRCLHPTVAPHVPLVFDLLDTWNGRSLGGCVYHVAHPGGRSYDVVPINANEAESRRLARFFAIGHSAGPMVTPPAEINPAFPLTLDLRRPIGG